MKVILLKRCKRKEKKGEVKELVMDNAKKTLISKNGCVAVIQILKN